MREVVQLQVGRCGNAVGTEFWQAISKEHCLDQLGKFHGKHDVKSDKIEVFFRKKKGGIYVPRTVMMDLEPGPLQEIACCEYGNLFEADNFVAAHKAAGGNWAKGYCTEGRELCDHAFDVIRKEAEKCDCLQCFQIVHSLGGGTGSGFGSLLMDNISEEYPGTLITTYSIIPSSDFLDLLTEPYNTVFSLRSLIYTSYDSFCVENEVLRHICQNSLQIPHPGFHDFNHIISTVMSLITTSLRFSGQDSRMVKKSAVNLIPFPRLHFLVPGYAPIYSRRSSPQELAINELTRDIFEAKNMLVDVNPAMGKYFTGACTFRGRMSLKEVDINVNGFVAKNSFFFSEWIPDNVKTIVCEVPSGKVKKCASFVGNTTTMQDMFKRAHSKFSALFQKKTFVHWYTGEGLDLEEFKEAESVILDIISEYQECQEAGIADTSSDHELELEEISE